MVSQEEIFEGAYCLMTEGEEKLKSKLVDGDNTWEL